jgi:ribonuclease HI
VITLNHAINFKEDPQAYKQCTPILPTLDYDIPWGYFDGVSQGHPPSCRVGVVMFINQNHYIYIRYAPGQGSNNKAELIAMWTLLETTKKKDIKKLQVMADSKLAIESTQGKLEIQNDNLENILRHIKLAFPSFEWIYFHHVLGS